MVNDVGEDDPGNVGDILIPRHLDGVQMHVGFKSGRGIRYCMMRERITRLHIASSKLSRSVYFYIYIFLGLSNHIISFIIIRVMNKIKQIFSGYAYISMQRIKNALGSYYLDFFHQRHHSSVFGQFTKGALRPQFSECNESLCDWRI